MKKYLEIHNIKWIHLTFANSQNIFDKFFNIISLYFSITKLIFLRKIDIFHCRGLPSASTGLFFKKFFNIKLIFDFRGLWADERVTKGGWDLSNRFHKIQYSFFKKREKKLFLYADRIIVLTERVLEEIVQSTNLDRSRISVIPCAADFEHFKIIDKRDKRTQNFINLPDKDAFVIGYLGSIGPMYGFKEYLELVISLNKFSGQTQAFYGLIITNDVKLADSIIKNDLEDAHHQFFIVKQSERKNIPYYLSYMTALTAFYTIKYSVISVSPTKIGEALACGIPVIVNSGIGDTDSILKKLNAGIILQDYSLGTLREFARNTSFPLIFQKSKVRSSARKLFDLELAIEKYSHIYESLHERND